MAVNKDEISNSEESHHMLMQTNAGIFSLLHSHEFVYLKYKGVTVNDWVDIIHMLMVYKHSHGSSRISNLTTRSEMFKMFLSIDSTDKTYAHLGYNEDLKFRMVKEIKKGVYLLGWILLVQGNHKRAYDSMLAWTTIGGGQYNAKYLLGYMCTFIFDKWYWHCKHTLSIDVYSLIFKLLVGFFCENNNFRGVLIGDIREDRFDVIALSQDDVSIAITALSHMVINVFLGYVHVLRYTHYNIKCEPRN